ncbi:MAG: HAD hydrolase family protein, partial [Actinobacteria bacterium]|nr:HAD hydrolase family protein [Actinomycetota bacterium]
MPLGFPREVEAFACDLDRTLLPETLVLGERTRAAIRAARAAGIHVLIVTGRMFQSVRP